MAQEREKKTGPSKNLSQWANILTRVSHSSANTHWFVKISQPITAIMSFHTRSLPFSDSCELALPTRMEWVLEWNSRCNDINLSNQHQYCLDGLNRLCILFYLIGYIMMPV